MTCRIVLKSLARWAAVCTLAFALTSPAFAADKITVFAAASLKNALDAVGAAWTADTGMEVAVSYAASSALAKQIQEGAPADVFMSADMDWMNTLAERKQIADGSIVKLLGNDLVLIATKESSLAVTLGDGAALAAALGDGKLAMGDVKAVPAGKYGKAALESLGLWPTVQGKVAMAENVRAALKLVATGEAPLGIVYTTDAMAEPAVKWWQPSLPVPTPPLSILSAASPHRRMGKQRVSSAICREPRPSPFSGPRALQFSCLLQSEAWISFRSAPMNGMPSG